MRFLYADSEPFPPGYDAIAAIERCVVHGARTIQLDDEIRVLHMQARSAREARRKAVQDLESFHASVMQVLGHNLQAPADSPAADYARRLADLASQLVEESKKSSAAAEEQDLQVERREVDRRRGELRAELEALLAAVRLPLVDVSVSMRMTDTRNELSAVFSHPGGIVAAFTLDTSKLAEWRQPRKVGEFAANVELPVSVKRGWFSKSVHHEKSVIDDSIIGSFDLGASRSAIRLRRKPADKDSLAIVLQKKDGQVTAELHYLDDPEAEEQRVPLDPPAVANLQRFWDGLLQALGPALAAREKLQSVTLAGQDVVAQDRGADLVDRLIAELAPIAMEIARRTPNASELILKLEKEGGRREELYVRKADLAARLQGLDPTQRARFAPLGILDESRRDSSPSVESAELAADDVLSQTEPS